MRISVIIPAFNEEQRIRACLKSIQDQTRKADEIIVVNNNSTDRTVAIAKGVGVTVIDEKHQGLIHARNRGFDESSGDIIARTDADTVVPPYWLEKIEVDFGKSKSIIAVSGPAIFGHSLFLPFVKIIWFELNRILLNHEGMYGPNMAIRKDIWKKVRKQVCLDDAAVHEDFDLAIHTSGFGEIYYDPDLVVKTSARRIKNPTSFFGEYLLKWKQTLDHHKTMRKNYMERKTRQLQNHV